MTCPGAWTHYGTWCYVVLHDPVNWYEAKTACAAVGGRVVEIPNADHNNFVTNMLKTHNGEEGGREGGNDGDGRERERERERGGWEGKKKETERDQTYRNKKRKRGARKRNKVRVDNNRESKRQTDRE